MTTIPESHPLREFFTELVGRHYAEEIGIRDPELRRQRLENFIDWVKAGKESYYIVSKFEHFEYAKVAPLFANLSRNFEECVYGLNRVKNELEELQHPIVRGAKELLM